MYKLSPSILSADFTQLYRDISLAAEGGADYIHVDVMDGHFVPNLSVGIPVLKSIRNAFPHLTLDVHLMIDYPDKYADAFITAGADILTIHLEAPNTLGVAKTLEHIRSRGVKAGLSIKPATPVKELTDLITLCDLALIMTVEPGFGGQSFIPHTMQKITELRALISERNPACELEIDGGVDAANLKDTLHAGADVVVMGSAVFAPGTNPSDRVRFLKALSESSSST